MDGVALLADLEAHNIRLEPRGERLEVRAPVGVLTPEMRQRIAKNKTELLALLRGELPASLDAWPEEWLENYIERAAIMEFDGGLPPVEAERRAEELIREAYRRKSDFAGGAK